MDDKVVSLTFKVVDGGLALFDQAGNKIRDVTTAAEQAGERGAAGFSRLEAGIISTNQALELFKKGIDVVTEGVKFLAEVTISQAEAAKQIEDLSQKIGIGVRELSGLSLAAKLADVGTEQLGRSMAQLGKHIAENSPMFEAMGVKTRDAAGHTRDLQSVLLNVADVFQKLPDGPTKTALSLELMSRAGFNLIPILNEGSKGLQELINKTAELGTQLGETDAKTLTAFANDVILVKEALRGMGLAIAKELLPEAEAITLTMQQWAIANRALLASDFKSFVDDFREILSIAKELSPLVAPVTMLVNAVHAFAGFKRAIRDARTDLDLQQGGGGMSTVGGGEQSALFGFVSGAPPPARPTGETDRERRIREAQQKSQAGAAVDDAEKQRLKDIADLAKDIDTQQKARQDALVIGARTQVELAQQQVTAAKEGVTSYDGQLAAAQAMDAARANVVQTEINILEQQRQQAQTQEHGGEVEKLTAEIEFRRVQQMGDLNKEAQKVTSEFEKAHRVTLNLADTLGGDVKRAVNGILNSGGGGFNASKILGDAAKTGAVDFISGLAAAELKKHEFDAHLTQNFTVTLPGIFKTGADALTSIWGKALDWLGVRTDQATTDIATSARDNLHDVSTSVSHTASEVGGALRNVPGVGNVSMLFTPEGGGGPGSTQLQLETQNAQLGGGQVFQGPGSTANQVATTAAESAGAGFGSLGAGVSAGAIGLGLSGLLRGNVGGAATLLGGVGGLATFAPGAISSATGLSAGAVGTLGGVAGAAGLLALVGQGALAASGPGHTTFNVGAGTAMSAGAGALSGAALGTTIGGFGWGTVIGAAVGAIVGAIAGSLGSSGQNIEKQLSAKIGTFFEQGMVPHASAEWGKDLGHSLLDRPAEQILARSPGSYEAQALFPHMVNTGYGPAGIAAANGQPYVNLGGAITVPGEEAGRKEVETQRAAAVALGTITYGPQFAAQFSDAVINNARILGETAKEVKEQLLALAKVAKVDLTNSLDSLKTQFGNNVLTQQQYTEQVQGIVTLFTEDLPPGVDASAIALKNMHTDMVSVVTAGHTYATLVEKTTLDTNDFNKALEKQKSLFSALQKDLEGGMHGGMAAFLTTSGSTLLAQPGEDITKRQSATQALGEQVKASIFSGAQTGIVEGIFGSLENSAPFKALEDAVAAAVTAATTGQAVDIPGLLASLNTYTTTAVTLLGPVVEQIDRIRTGLSILPSALHDTATQIRESATNMQVGLLRPRQQEARVRGEIATVNQEIAAQLAGANDPAILQQLYTQKAGFGADLAGFAGQYAQGSGRNRALTNEGASVMQQAADSLDALGVSQATNTSALVGNTAAVNTLTAAILNGNAPNKDALFGNAPPPTGTGYEAPAVPVTLSGPLVTTPGLNKGDHKPGDIWKGNDNNYYGVNAAGDLISVPGGVQTPTVANSGRSRADDLINWALTRPTQQKGMTGSAPLGPAEITVAQIIKETSAAKLAPPLPVAVEPTIDQLVKAAGGHIAAEQKLAAAGAAQAAAFAAMGGNRGPVPVHITQFLPSQDTSRDTPLGSVTPAGDTSGQHGSQWSLDALPGGNLLNTLFHIKGPGDSANKQAGNTIGGGTEEINKAIGLYNTYIGGGERSGYGASAFTAGDPLGYGSSAGRRLSHPTRNADTPELAAAILKLAESMGGDMTVTTTINAEGAVNRDTIEALERMLIRVLQRPRARSAVRDVVAGR